MAQKRLLTLKQWINKEGVNTVADKLGIWDSTVRHWRLGNSLPTPKQMFAIKKISKGSVTYSSMIDNHFNPRA